MGKLIDVLVRCTERLQATIPDLRKHRYKEIVESARSIRKLEKEGDAIFRAAVSALVAWILTLPLSGAMAFVVMLALGAIAP